MQMLTADVKNVPKAQIFSAFFRHQLQWKRDLSFLTGQSRLNIFDGYTTNVRKKWQGNLKLKGLAAKGGIGILNHSCEVKGEK